MNFQLTEARKQIYALLSHLFLGPPPESLLKSVLSESELTYLDDFSEPVNQAISEFIKACQSTGEADQLKQEYNNLFVVPVGEYVPPYESVFMDEMQIGPKKISGLLMGQSAIDVKRWYHQAGMEISTDIKELPDHMGIELSFMAHLCEQEEVTAKNGDQDLVAKIQDTQLGFLEAHLKRWAKRFAQKVKEKTTSNFYVSMCQLNHVIIEEDYTLLKSYSITFP